MPKSLRMAAVYRAYEAGLDRYVAPKILPRHFASDPQFIGWFKQEAPEPFDLNSLRAEVVSAPPGAKRT